MYFLHEKTFFSFTVRREEKMLTELYSSGSEGSKRKGTCMELSLSRREGNVFRKFSLRKRKVSALRAVVLSFSLSLAISIHSHRVRLLPFSSNNHTRSASEGAREM